VATLGFKQPYCDRQGYTAADGIHPYLLVGQRWRLESKMIQKQEERKSRGPLAALKRMVTIPRKLNINHPKSHIISELSKKMEME
jgi:hypothetical protein